jgi:hypothetical protein
MELEEEAGEEIKGAFLLCKIKVGKRLEISPVPQ